MERFTVKLSEFFDSDMLETHHVYLCDTGMVEVVKPEVDCLHDPDSYWSNLYFKFPSAMEVTFWIKPKTPPQPKEIVVDGVTYVRKD